jgi:hypothetical protein
VGKKYFRFTQKIFSTNGFAFRDYRVSRLEAGNIFKKLDPHNLRSIFSISFCEEFRFLSREKKFLDLIAGCGDQFLFEQTPSFAPLYSKTSFLHDSHCCIFFGRCDSIELLDNVAEINFKLVQIENERQKRKEKVQLEKLGQNLRKHGKLLF